MDKIQISDSKIQYLQVFLISFAVLGFELISGLPEKFGVDSRIVSVPYRGFYFLLCLLVLLHFKWGRKVNIYFIPVILFIVLYFIRSVFDSFYKYDELSDRLLEFWLFAYVMGFFPMASLLFKVNRITLDRSKLVLFVIAIIVNIIGFGNNYDAFSDEKIGGRFSGNEVLNQISYGQTGVVLIILCLSYFYDLKLFGKIGLIPIIGLGLLNVALAGSRGPMIELSLVIISFVVINFRKIGALNLSAVLIFFIGLGFYFQDYLLFFDTVLDRLENTGFNQGSGSEERYFLYQEAWQHFCDYPITGYQAVGIYPHNLILEALVALGFVGGILLVYIILISFRNFMVLVSIKATNWVALIFLMHIISTFLSGAIWNSFPFWSLLALSFSLFQNRELYNEENNGMKQIATN